jgi:bla regulator protein blaR1
VQPPCFTRTMKCARRSIRLNFRHLFATGFVILGVQSRLADAQILHATGNRPSFEVATIKPWKRTPPPLSDGTSGPVKPMKVSPIGAGGQPTSRVHMILPAALLIASAYNLPVGSENRFLRGPGWLQQDIDQYEIDAKIPDSLFAAMQRMTPAQQREQVSLMEQSLLADRFNLRVHFETMEMPVYALVVAKGGTKLTPALDGETSRLSSVGNQLGMKMTASSVALEQFALSPLLTGAVGRMISDQTGLKGTYDFTLTWKPDAVTLSDATSDAAKNAPDAPSLFTAIQEQLGLRLVPSKAPAEVIVVDHVDPPSPN